MTRECAFLALHDTWTRITLFRDSWLCFFNWHSCLPAFFREREPVFRIFRDVWKGQIFFAWNCFQKSYRGHYYFLFLLEKRWLSCCRAPSVAKRDLRHWASQVNHIYCSQSTRSKIFPLFITIRWKLNGKIIFFLEFDSKVCKHETVGLFDGLSFVNLFKNWFSSQRFLGLRRSQEDNNLRG